MRILTGHHESIEALAFGPNQLLASGGRDRRLRLWNLAGNQEIVHILSGHRDVISGLGFSPDGQFLVSCSWDGTIRIWDVIHGRSVHTVENLRGQRGPLLSMAFSLDGRLAVAGGEANIANPIHLLGMGVITTTRTLRGHDHKIGALAFGPSSSDFLASGGADMQVRIWNLQRSECVALILLDQRVQGIAFAPAGDLLVTAASRVIRTWQLAAIQADTAIPLLQTASLDDDDEPATLPINPTLPEWGHGYAHTEIVQAIAFLPNDQLVSVSRDATVGFWHIPNPHQLSRHPRLSSRINPGIGPLRTLAIAPDGLTMAVAGDAGKITLLDLE